MQRIKIEQPTEYTFSTHISIRIGDVNYGNHVGNDAFLSLLHEARMQYLLSLGYTELSMGGVALIMADAAIEFKAEMHYGDVVKIEIEATGFTRLGFDLVYKMTIEKDGQSKLAGLAKTGMLCFDFASKKIKAIPTEVLHKLQQ